MLRSGRRGEAISGRGSRCASIPKPAVGHALRCIGRYDEKGAQRQTKNTA